MSASIDAASSGESAGGAGQDLDRASATYRAVDRARRTLLVSAERFRGLLLEQVEVSGGAPAPRAESGSLRALVAAFCAAGRGAEIEAAARTIVRARSLAYDIT